MPEDRIGHRFTRGVPATALPPPPPKFENDGEIQIAASAPEFALPGIDGHEHTLEEYADADALVLIQMATICPYIRAWEDRIKAIHSDYSRRNVAVVAISSNAGQLHSADAFDGMKRRAKREGFAFDYLRDEDQSLARALGSTMTPEVFVFGRDGRLAYHGMIDDSHDETKVTHNYLRDALESLLAGKGPAVAETSPAGCTIKWLSSAPTKVDLSGMRTPIDDALADGCPVALSYIGADGHPQLTFEGSVQVLGSDRLAIWAVSPEEELPKAIAKNPDVTLVYNNPKTRTYYTFRGRARVDASVNKMAYSNLQYMEATFDPDMDGIAIVVDIDGVQGNHRFQGFERSGPINMAR